MDNKAGKNKKANIFVRIGRWFGRVGRAIAKYFKEVVGEVKKLSWPSRKELISYSLAVLGFCALMAVIIGLLDFGFSEGVTWLAGIGQ